MKYTHELLWEQRIIQQLNAPRETFSLWWLVLSIIGGLFWLAPWLALAR